MRLGREADVEKAEALSEASRTVWVVPPMLVLMVIEDQSPVVEVAIAEEDGDEGSVLQVDALLEAAEEEAPIT